jgi:hypothetical protein
MQSDLCSQQLEKSMKIEIRSGLISWVSGLVEEIISDCARSQDRQHRGGYFGIGTTQGDVLFTMAVGRILDSSAAERRLTFCVEKIRRLGNNPGHLSSWQSRDPDNGRYGGAIRTRRHILSFSGFPELHDEAAMVSLATFDAGFFGFSLARRKRIRQISNNELILPL